MQDLFKTPPGEAIAPSRLDHLPAPQRPIAAEALELRRAFGARYLLDLSIASAESLDQILTEQLAVIGNDPTQPASVEEGAKLVRRLGAYLAALLVTHRGARPLALSPMPLLLTVPTRAPDTAPLHTSHHRVAMDAWEGGAARLAEAFHGLMAADDVTFDRPLFVPSYMAPEEEGEAIWLRAQSLQVLFGQFEDNTWNLTYVPHNLRYPDVYLMRTFNPIQTFRVNTLTSDPEKQNQWLLQATAAFFGEMARQHVGARWIDPARGPVEMHMQTTGSRFSPLRICADALEDKQSNYPLMRAYKQLMDFQSAPDAGAFPLTQRQADEALLVSTGLRALSRAEHYGVPATQPDGAPSKERKISVLSELRSRLARGEDLDVEATQMLDVSQLLVLQADAERARALNSDNATAQNTIKLIEILRAHGVLPAQQDDGDTLEAAPAPPNTSFAAPTQEIPSDDADRTIEASLEELMTMRDRSRATEGLRRATSTLEEQRTPTRDEGFEATRIAQPDPSLLERDDADQTRDMDRAVLMATLNAMRSGSPSIKEMDPDATSEISLDQLQAVRAHMMIDSRDAAPTIEQDRPPTHAEEATPEGDDGEALSAEPETVDEGSAPSPTPIAASSGGVRYRPTRNIPVEAFQRELTQAPAEEAEDDASVFDAPTVHGEAPAELIRQTLLGLGHLKATPESMQGTMELTTVLQASPETMTLDKPDLSALTPGADAAHPFIDPEDDDDDEPMVMASFVMADEDEDSEVSDFDLGSGRPVSGRYAPLVLDEDGLDDIPAAKTYPTRLLSIMNRLVPILVAAGWEGQEQVSSQSLLPNSPFEARLPRVTVAIDQLGQLRYIEPDDLVAWGCTFADLRDLAGMNLDNRALDPMAHLHPTRVQGIEVIQVDTGGNFEGSLLLTPRLGQVMRERIGTDQLWVGIPNRHTLLVTSALGDSQGLQAFTGIVRYYHDTRPAPLCDEVFLYAPPGPRLQNIVTI
ncbi:MAG: hypothetical protein CMH57_03385 [Myxococcales bacterium]|nr:hypothetical protein [Myxococcales bacterium]